MKVLLLLSFASMSLFANSGKELESEALRKLTCDVIYKTNYNIRTKLCMENSITIEESAAITFEGKEYTSMLIVQSKIKDTVSVVELNRSLTITSNEIVKGDWTAKTLSVEYGTFHKILAATTGSSNVKKLKTNKTVPAKVKAFALEYAKDNANYSSEISYYVIKDGRKKIGYIAYVWYESEDDDIKGYVEQNFDLKGNKVGDSSEESFGYHE